MTESYQKFGVLGGGAWGTALALSMRRAGRDVLLWARDPAVVESMNTLHENTKRLPGIALDKALRATGDRQALADCDALILATPAQLTRAVARDIAVFASGKPIILAAKGIELGSSQLLTEVVRQEVPQALIGLISGPSFAGEVARGLPTALTLALDPQAPGHRAVGEALAAAMASPTFRLYLSDDIIGVQIGGALKNVLAIACGIVAGRALGENACAALMTRGMAEIIRLGVALGGRAETLMGLSGLGDVALTCSSSQSRNTALGIALGQGTTLEQLRADGGRYLTEGVATAGAATALAKQAGVEMPIVVAVDAIVNHGASIDSQISALLARPLKTEAL